VTLRPINVVPYELDAGVAARAAIGLVVLASDHTLEYEFQSVLPQPGVAVYVSRIEMSAKITPETLRDMTGRITANVANILPGQQLDTVCFCCTSASMAIGEKAVFELIHRDRPEAACTTPITAAFAAFEALDVRRIGLLTPYREDVNLLLRNYIEARGLEVVRFDAFDQEDDNVVGHISADSVYRAALNVGRADNVDAVFVSCTNLRFVERIAALEAALGKPVVSSNQALSWHALRLAGIDDKTPQFGSLFSL